MSYDHKRVRRDYFSPLPSLSLYAYELTWHVMTVGWSSSAESKDGELSDVWQTGASEEASLNAWTSDTDKPTNRRA